jgi:hypothetical protein
MPYERTIAAVRQTLRDAFAELDVWFDRPAPLRFKPPSGGWSIDQVLEHVTLTNHFLMLTLRKWVETAVRRAEREAISARESDLQRFEMIGQRGSFGWVRPEHMEPTGRPTSAEVRAILHQQLAEGEGLLDRMGRGERSLCRITLTVNNLGKIDLYQWLYFLAQHARRHLQQLIAIEETYPAEGLLKE